MCKGKTLFSGDKPYLCYLFRAAKPLTIGYTYCGWKTGTLRDPSLGISLCIACMSATRGRIWIGLLKPSQSSHSQCNLPGIISLLFLPNGFFNLLYLKLFTKSFRTYQYMVCSFLIRSMYLLNTFRTIAGKSSFLMTPAFYEEIQFMQDEGCREMISGI